MSRLLWIFLFLLTFFGACMQKPESGIDTSGFDTSVRAQDDYYEYINGTWLERTKIPPDKSNYGA